MARLKTKTGCLTCLTRKKKCDERAPTCGDCERLGLHCVRRESRRDGVALPSATRMRGSTAMIRAPPSQGFLPFTHELQKELVSESSVVLRPLVSCIADPVFRDIGLFGQLCAQSHLVRDAIVAFAAHSRRSSHHDADDVSIRSYQNCIASLKRGLVDAVGNSSNADLIVIAVMFLGLLESLKLGDPRNAVAHFEVCRRLLQDRIVSNRTWRNAELANVYRIVAECVIYNLATLSIFNVSSISDWGCSFDCLFDSDDRRLSPFLGGFHDLYQVIFRINCLMASRRQVISLEDHAAITNTGETLWQQLQSLENRIEKFYPESADAASSTRLYRTKMRVSVFALRIHLCKVVFPSITSSDRQVQNLLASASDDLRRQSIYEPGNVALVWPLTILACAAERSEDFEFIVETIRGFSQIIAPAYARRLIVATDTLRRFRNGLQPSARDRGGEDSQELQKGKGGVHVVDQMDFLLEPRLLYQSICMD